jgi:chromatin modification-related protein YNG2
LQELRSKETQSQGTSTVPSSIFPNDTVPELQQEIAKDSHKFIRHALRTDCEVTGKDKPSPPPPTEKIQQAQNTLSIIADEKIALAERIVELLSRKRSRLDYDLGRVLVLQGEPDPAAVVAGAVPLMSAGAGGASTGSGYVLGGRNPAAHINESLRNAFSGATIPALNTGSAATVGSRTSGTEESAHKSM